MVHTVVGIDPGLDGGLVALDVAGRWRAGLRMPTLSTPKSNGGERRLVDVGPIADFLRDHRPTLVVIEDVFSSSQMGVVGAFSFGEGKGVLRAACGVLGLPVLWVSPLVWKGRLGVLVNRGTNSKAVHRKNLKKAAIRKAQALFPGVKAVAHDGVAEAGLLAAYGLLSSSHRVSQD